MKLDEIERKRELIEAHKRRKHQLELKAALGGYSIDPEVKTEIEDIEEKIKQLEKEIEAFKTPTKLLPEQTPLPGQKSLIQLRSQMILDLGFDDGIRRVKKKGFFNAERNKQGKGIFHRYERLERQGENLVIDHTTGLTWQQSGSPNLMPYSDAKRYIDTLNGQRFAGYSDWRFPTLDEAMSLMEPDEKNGDLYIDSVFDETQPRIWTADQSGSGGVWKVSFFDGTCEIMDPGPHGYVRAVR